MIVDLRSDTVTRPSPAMYAAMAAAPLGDDVLGDDPTVARLESLAAETTGKEAAMFVPSGTMSNQIAVASWCRPGEAILIEEEAHMIYYEVGGTALIAGVVSWTLPSDRGAMDPDRVEARVTKSDLHTPGTTLLCLENTHNRAGGAIVPLDHFAAYREIADRRGLRIHLDGARLFNAVVASGVSAREWCSHTDSVSICLSKGLRSPIGSVLCGPRDFIERARVWRKRLGGGMRQAGVLAACGIVSLTQEVDRLADDHRRARMLAEAVREAGFAADEPDTNIVLVTTRRAAVEVVSDLGERGVACFPVASHRLRLVLHADVDDSGVDRAVAAFRSVTT